MRTCVACRQPDGRDALIRLVRGPDGHLVVDYRARLPGRGAWVHPRRECVEHAGRRGVLSRALRGPVDAGALSDQVRNAVLRACADGLSMAAAGGALVGGHDALSRALEDGSVVDVVVAEDASERTVASLRKAAGDLSFTSMPLTREALGAKVGSAPRAAVGVRLDHASTHLRRQLRRLRDLG